MYRHLQLHVFYLAWVHASLFVYMYVYVCAYASERAGSLNERGIACPHTHTHYLTGVMLPAGTPRHYAPAWHSRMLERGKNLAFIPVLRHSLICPNIIFVFSRCSRETDARELISLRLFRAENIVFSGYLLSFVFIVWVKGEKCLQSRQKKGIK